MLLVELTEDRPFSTNCETKNNIVLGMKTGKRVIDNCGIDSKRLFCSGFYFYTWWAQLAPSGKKAGSLVKGVDENFSLIFN